MKCALSLLPVPSHWLQRGVPGHTSTMDTAQRSQAPSQIAGLPHWIHCSNYTISCHYSCYLDLSSWSAGRAGGELVQPWRRGKAAASRDLHLRLQNGAVLGFLEGKLFWHSLCPASDGRDFTNLLPPSVPVYQGLLCFWFFSLHVPWSLLEPAVQNKVWSDAEDNQHYTKHCVIS